MMVFSRIKIVYKQNKGNLFVISFIKKFINFSNLNTKIQNYKHKNYNKSNKLHFQELQKMNESQEQDKMIKQQQINLIKQKQEESKRNQLTYKNVSIWNDANYKPAKTVQNNKHSFSIYADKLLIHLVIEQKFDFVKIAQFMSYTFKQQFNQYTEQTCRQRWYEIHRDRQFMPQIKQKQMQDKRVKSIMSMTDPFLLYNINEKLYKMEKQQKIFPVQPNQFDYKYEGYNIFKDSIRKIDDIDKYNQLQKHMRQALGKAAKQVELQKPMLYTPYYDRLQQFQVLEEQLTLQRMQQMMSHPIQMQLMQRQLKVLDLNQRNYESRIKKQVQKKVKQQKIKNQQEFEIQQNWDDYESD